MAVREGLSPLSRLICEIVISVGQGNFTFVRKNSGNVRNLWLQQPCYYHNRGHQQHRLLQSVIILIIMFLVVLIPSCAVVLVLPVLKRVFTLSSLSLSFSSYSFCRIPGQYVCWINVSQSLKSLRIIRYCSFVYQC